MAGGIEAANRKEILEAEDKGAFLKSLRKRCDAIASPFRTAEAFSAEEIIDPRDSRPLLVDFVHPAWRTLETGTTQFGPRP